MKNFCKIPRLFVSAPLALSGTVSLSKEQSHYLGRVLRLKEGDFIRLFNGKEGEFLTRLSFEGKQAHSTCEEILKQQVLERGPCLFFSPIKKHRMDFLIEKAVELGVQTLVPTLMDRTVVRSFNVEKARAHIIEAAEQCERLTIPEILSPIKLKDIFTHIPQNKKLYFCQERSEGESLEAVNIDAAILIGPEGGFKEEEITFLRSGKNVVSISLGGRILRAETAALCALSRLV